MRSGGLRVQGPGALKGHDGRIQRFRGVLTARDLRRRDVVPGRADVDLRGEVIRMQVERLAVARHGLLQHGAGIDPSLLLVLGHDHPGNGQRVVVGGQLRLKADRLLRGLERCAQLGCRIDPPAKLPGREQAVGDGHVVERLGVPRVEADGLPRFLEGRRKVDLRIVSAAHLPVSLSPVDPGPEGEDLAQLRIDLQGHLAGAQCLPQAPIRQLVAAEGDPVRLALALGGVESGIARHGREDPAVDRACLIVEPQRLVAVVGFGGLVRLEHVDAGLQLACFVEPRGLAVGRADRGKPAPGPELLPSGRTARASGTAAVPRPDPSRGQARH